MKKYLNIAIFLSFSLIYLAFSSHFKYSTNFLELFFSKDTTSLFHVISKLGLSNNIYVAKKGFSEDSLDELYGIAKKLEKLPQISKVTISLLPSKELKDYYKKNYYLLADFNSTKLTDKEIYESLKKDYEALQDSFIYVPLDTNDPLHLFGMKFFKGERYLKLKDYGYMLKASTNIDTASAKEAKILYDEVKQILKPHKDTLSYAPFYFLVENSSYIKKDTQRIITLATVLLLVLYFFMLKNYKILIHSILSISSSVLGAIMFSEMFFDSINVMVLAFGISITTVSIDYMFHYYFHGDFAKKTIIKQKKVLFGFLTTFGVFVIFSFIDIKLFYQLAFFSATSLLIAFLIFTFTFGYLDIKQPNQNKQLKQTKTFNPRYVILVSMLLLAYSYANLEFDNNLKNLDYKNTRLQELSKLFNQNLKNPKYQSVILMQKTPELVLKKYEELQKIYPDMLGIGKFVFTKKKCQKRLDILKNYDFKALKKQLNTQAKKVGFNDSFKDAYANISDISCDMKVVDEVGFKIIKEGENYYTMVLIPKGYEVIYDESIKPLDITKILSKDMQKTKTTITKFMFVSVVFIVIMLVISSGLDMLYPLSFVLFPISVVLFFISLLGMINIMHLFALIILIAISIDYGVYMHNTNTLSETTMAIKYALLSTLAGFGVLIFSDTVALHSIGFVISVGIGAIFVLVYGRK